MSTSVQLVLPALRAFVSTLQVPTLARPAGLGLDRLLMDWDVKVRKDFTEMLVNNDKLFAYSWEFVPFVQMLTSVLRVACVLEGCVPTHWDPSPAPNVKLATDYPKTGRDVKVHSTSSFSFSKTISVVKNLLNTCVYFVSSLLNSALLLIWSFSKYYSVLLQSYMCVFPSDIDECRSLSICSNGICLNSEGSYTCENCPTGYTVSLDGELCQGGFI